MDFFNNLIDEEEHILKDEDFIPMEVLMNEINCLSTENHQLYYLFKQFNMKYLSQDEMNIIDGIIDKLLNKQKIINKRNIDKLQVADLGTAKIL